MVKVSFDDKIQHENINKLSILHRFINLQNCFSFQIDVEILIVDYFNDTAASEKWESGRSGVVIHQKKAL